MMAAKKDIIKEENVCMLSASTKDEALRAMANLLKRDFSEEEVAKMLEAILYRETLMSTGIGLGIGVPHIRTDLVHDPIVLIGLCNPPLQDYESMDNKPVQLIVMILTGKAKHREHTIVLAQIVSALKKNGVMDAVVKARSADELYKILKTASLRDET